MSRPQSSSLEVPQEYDGEQLASSASTLAGEPPINEKVKESGSSRHSAASISSNKKEEAAAGDGSTDEPDDIVYPSGLKMFFIVVALVMSIFLLALDMVSTQLYP